MRLKFQVRVNEKATLGEMGDRVGNVLQCRFTETTGKAFGNQEALECSLLGMWVTLNYWPQSPEGAWRNYRLVGTLREDLTAKWAIDSPRIDIGAYILGLLTQCGEDQWYIPTKEELRNGPVLPD